MNFLCIWEMLKQIGNTFNKSHCWSYHLFSRCIGSVNIFVRYPWTLTFCVCSYDPFMGNSTTPFSTSKVHPPWQCCTAFKLLSISSSEQMHVACFYKSIWDILSAYFRRLVKEGKGPGFRALCIIQQSIKSNWNCINIQREPDEGHSWMTSLSADLGRKHIPRDCSLVGWRLHYYNTSVLCTVALNKFPFTLIEWE